METIEVQVSSELANQLRPYIRQLPQILALGLRQMQEQTTSEVVTHRRRVQAALQAAGLSQPQSAAGSPTGLLSAEERAELGSRFVADRPLSDLIIEERGER